MFGKFLFSWRHKPLLRGSIKEFMRRRMEIVYTICKVSILDKKERRKIYYIGTEGSVLWYGRQLYNAIEQANGTKKFRMMF